MQTLTTGISFLSLSGKSTVDVVGNLESWTALLGHFALRAPSRRVWRVDFGVMEWGVMRAAIPLGCCVVGVAES